MKIPMKVLRWVMLAMYVALVTSFFVIAYRRDDFGGIEWMAWLLGIMIVAQLLFIFGAGTNELWQPLGPRRRLLPAIVAGAMFGLLAFGLFAAISELVLIEPQLEENFPAERILIGIALLNWVLWGFLFFIYTRQMERFRAIRNLLASVFAGSLFELMVTVPSHMIVAKRPGCFVGIYTLMGIVAGIFVMMWAFGPGLLLLFLHHRYRSEKEKKKG